MILCDRCGKAGAHRVDFRPVILTLTPPNTGGGIELDLCNACRYWVADQVLVSLHNLRTEVGVHLRRLQSKEPPCTSTPPASS